MERYEIHQLTKVPDDIGAVQIPKNPWGVIEAESHSAAVRAWAESRLFQPGKLAPYALAVGLNGSRRIFNVSVKMVAIEVE